MRLPARPGRRNWPVIALVASLLLNGFLVGLLAADALRSPHRTHGSRGERIASFELRRLADRLPEEARQQVEAELAPLAPDMEARLGRIRALRAEIGVLAAAPEPDRAAIDEKLVALRAEARAMQEAAQRATYDAVLALPPEMRARLAEPPQERRSRGN